MDQQPKPLDLEAVEQRANAATDGPWYLQPEYGPEFIAAEVRGYEHGIGNLEFGAGGQARRDREFVIAARTDVPALVAEIRRLTTELAPYDALQLGHPDGRLSTTCTAGKHPTWLRYPADTHYYACPWCESDRLRAELANRRVRALIDAGDHEAACAAAEAFEASEAYDVTHPRV